MAVPNRSAFIYGHTVTSSNEWIDFDEGGGELSCTIQNGSWSLGEYVDKVAEALNGTGDNEYTVSLDRTSRKITISADASFDLLVSTGTHNSISAFALLGFSTNQTGTDTYEAVNASGSLYEPQYRLQKYQSFLNLKRTLDVKVNESSDGSNVEVVSTGTKQLMECQIKYATNIVEVNGCRQSAIDANATGVEDLRTFLDYVTLKRPVEFLEDKTLTPFVKCILEKTSVSSNGVDYDLRNMYASGWDEYYDTGLLTFRQIS